jgi:hypothetical protein
MISTEKELMAGLNPQVYREGSILVQAAGDGRQWSQFDAAHDGHEAITSALTMLASTPPTNSQGNSRAFE